MRVRNNPSCECCQCEIQPTPSEGYWAGVYGDWAFNGSGPVFDMEIDEDGAIFTNVYQPDNYMSVSVDVHVTEWCKIMVMLAYFDEDNYLGAELSFADDCGLVRLIQRSGGSNTELRGWTPVEGLEPNTTHHITVCYSPYTAAPERGNVFSATVPAPNGLTRTIAAFGVETSAINAHAGVRTTTIVGHTPVTFTFTNWHWYYAYDPYEHPDCPPCHGARDCLVMGSPAELPHCEWNEESGSGEFDTNTLRTSTSLARIITEVEHPLLNTNFHIEAQVEFDTAGDSALFIVGWKDSSNYCYGKITCGEECGTITLGEVVAGTPTETSQVSLYAVVGLRQTVCLDLIDGAGVMIVTAEDDIGQNYSIRQVRASLTVDPEGYKAGLAVGTISGEVVFYGWSWYLTVADDADCDSCHSCAQHDDDFTRLYDPPTLGCEWDDDTHPIEAGGYVVLAPGESITSQIAIYGTGVVASFGYTWPGDPGTVRLSIGSRWAEIDGGTLEDSQGETDLISTGAASLTLCLHDGASRATVGSGVKAFVSSTASISGTTVTISNTGGEDVQIHDFRVTARAIDDQICLGCASSCTSCEDNAWPSAFAVTISGLQENPDFIISISGEDCCGVANGTYYISDRGDNAGTEDCVVTGLKCRAWDEFDLCDQDTASPKSLKVSVYLRPGTGTTVEMWVTLVLDTGPTIYVMSWRKSIASDQPGDTIDCLVLSEDFDTSHIQTPYAKALIGSCAEDSQNFCNDLAAAGVSIHVQAV